MAGRPQSIGAELRAAREARGETTADVARQLRLRESYIESIEFGNFEALPGGTYAIGFLRSYARYLRLDSDDLIQRFKEEVSDITPSSDLAFFEPVSESRVPRGGLVVLAVLLAIVAYAGWYYLSTRDMTVADLVPSVPEQLMNMVKPSDRADAPQPTTVSPGSSATQAQRDVIPPGPDEDTDEDTEGSTPPPEMISGPQSGGAVSVASPDLGPDAEPNRIIPAVPQVASEAARGDGAGDGPRVYGEGNLDARVIIRATADSWIQVRTAEDSLLMTRTLRPGDSYRVPNQPGLKLMTGNAGGLELLVDGQVAPAIGVSGSVRRNVPLDPERLRAGTTGN